MLNYPNDFSPALEHTGSDARSAYASLNDKDEVVAECTYTGGNTLRAVAGTSSGRAFAFLDGGPHGAYFAAADAGEPLFQALVGEITRRQWFQNSDPRSADHFSCDVDAFADRINEAFGVEVEATV